MRRQHLAPLVLAVVVLLVAGLAATGRLPARHQRTAVTAATDQALPGHRGPPGSETWAPWPQALHDAQHSGAATVEGPVTGHVRWTRRLEGNVTPGPVVGADGTIYAASNAGVLHALDPATGADRWTLDGGAAYGIDQSTSPAVLPDGSVLWPGPHNTLWSVTPAGAVRWQLALSGTVTSPAATADGDVVVGDSSGRLVGLRPTASGPGVAWDVELGEGSYGSPVIAADGRTAFQSVVSGVVAVRDGTVLWRSRAPRATVEVSPAVGPDGTVVIGTNDPFQYGLDPDDGHVRWTYRRGPWTYSSPGVTRDGIVYFGDHANRVTGLDAVTGLPIYRHQGSTARDHPRSIGIWTSVLVDAAHRVYVGTRQGLVYAADRDGKRLWQVDAGATVDSYPALTADGTLLVGVTDGRLLAIGD
ncbi:MAG: PQQ-binding-like beta-propeller repeat protein [Sporichthyaceae bacterium]